MVKKFVLWLFRLCGMLLSAGDDCSFHLGVGPEKIMFVKAENHTERLEQPLRLHIAEGEVFL